jgi:hypothetical protein
MKFLYNMDIDTILSLCSYQVESTEEGQVKDLQERINRIQRFQTEQPVKFALCLKQCFNFLQKILVEPKAKTIPFTPEKIDEFDLDEINFFVWDFFIVLEKLNIVSYPGGVAKEWLGTSVGYYQK